MGEDSSLIRRYLVSALAFLWVMGIVSAFLPCASARLAPSSWPMFAHDTQHTGRSASLGAQSGELLWELDIGSPGKSVSPAIGTDVTVYIGG